MVDKLGGEPVIPYSVAFESEIFEMGEEKAAEYLKKNKFKSILPTIIKKGYHALRMIHFFTCGPQEVRAWSIREGCLAPQAAGTIHTDFEKGFICAKIYKFRDYQKRWIREGVQGSWFVKHSKVESGRNAVTGDVCHFEHNAAKEEEVNSNFI